MLGSKHHVCESHTVLHMYTPESTPSALQQCVAPSYTLPRKPHNLIFIHISNYMYVFIYIYMSVRLCVCRVPPPWNLPFWYPPSSPSPEDFFRYPPQLHPRPSAADMPRSLALFSCSNPRLPFDLSPFPLKWIANNWFKNLHLVSTSVFSPPCLTYRLSKSILLIIAIVYH